MTPSESIRGALQAHADGVRGHVYDAADLGRRLAVELLVDGELCGLARADGFAPEIGGVGDGCYGFGFALPEGVMDAGGVVEVRLANTGRTVGEPLRLGPSFTPAEPLPGRVMWSGGLRLSGWLGSRPAGDAARVTALIERRPVCDAVARSWTSIRQGSLMTPVAAFDVHLPTAYADGRVHLVTVIDGEGRILAGSPCAIVAFPDGLKASLIAGQDADAGDPRVALIEALVPQSLPFSEFDAWEARHGVPQAGPAARGPACAVVLVGDALGSSIESLERQGPADWVALQVAGADGPGDFDPAEVSSFLAQEPDLDLVVFALSGTRFRRGALERLAAGLEGGSSLAYGDALAPSAPHIPLLWPCYDGERQLEQGYAALVFAAPVGAVVDALGQGASSIFDLVLTLVRQGAAKGGVPTHVPDVVATLPPLSPDLGQQLARASAAHTGSQTAVEEPDRTTGLPVVRVLRRSLARALAIAVIHPGPVTPEAALALERLVRPDAELILVGHATGPEIRGWRRIVVDGPRNPSRLRNAALEAASAPDLLLIDGGIAPLDGAAIDELKGRRIAGKVAGVAGLIVSPEGVVVSAGCVLGPSFAVAPAFGGRQADEGGYSGELRVARACGALDGSCILVDRDLVVAVGGFDADVFPDLYGGVDLSLRLRAQGYRLLHTPRARFLQSEAARPSSGPRQEAERAALRQRWGKALMEDPSYHPCLNRDGAPFSALAWPPSPRSPRPADARPSPHAR